MQGRTFNSSMKKEPKYSLPRLSLNSSNRQKLGGKLSKINYFTISKYTKRVKLNIILTILIFLVMVILQLSVPTSLNIKSKLPHYRDKPPLKLTYTFPSNSVIANSQQPENPISLFPPANQVFIYMLVFKNYITCFI